MKCFYKHDNVFHAYDEITFCFELLKKERLFNQAIRKNIF